MIRDVVRYQSPKEWGLLCIDTWDCQGQNDEFYVNAVNQLETYKISAVVNCTMDLHFDYNDLSINNTLEQYHWNRDPYISGQLADIILLDLVKATGKQPTSRIIQNKFFDKNTVHLSRKETFIYHTQKYHPYVQDWIVLGSAWKLCLHIGPLGIDKLVDIVSHKFYIFPEWSIQNENRTVVSRQQIHDDFLVWAPIPNDGYRLITRANNHKWAEANAGNF